MKKRRMLVALSLAASTLALPIVASAQANANAAAPQAQAEAEKTRTFALQHIDKAQMLEWLHSQPRGYEPGVVPLPAGLAEVRAVEAGNALFARGTAASLHELATTIGALDQPIQLIGCSVQAFLLQPGEAERIMNLGSKEIEDAMKNTSATHATQITQAIALQKQMQMSALMTSPGVYVISGAGTWISGVPAMLRLAQSPQAPGIGLMVGLRAEENEGLTVSIKGPFPNEGGYFETRTSGRFDGNSTGYTSARLTGKLAEAMERAGAPRNADMVIIATPRLIQTATAQEAAVEE